MARGLRFDCFARLEFREQKKPHCFQLNGSQWGYFYSKQSTYKYSENYSINKFNALIITTKSCIMSINGEP